MRVLYLILGLLLGMFYVSKVGLIALDNRDWQYERDITAYTLTGMSEGWERGRFWTEEKYRWQMSEMMDELLVCYQGQRDIKRRKCGK